MQESTVTIDIEPRQIELALVALYVFHEVREGSPYPADLLIDKALRFYDIKRMPLPMDNVAIGQLADALFHPLYDSRLTPADRLRMVDIDPGTISEEEVTAIIRDIEANYGPITRDDFDRAFAS